ncbi:MAG: hypothetical protein H8D23_15030 [Candidatus Brocadiales bacterium]|nr:hypothetical protein [Candidatus Brocadiales bacterium]MBL7121734.1 hypothetical protein [Candidatus Neomarinimicrobiota bacterium]
MKKRIPTFEPIAISEESYGRQIREIFYVIDNNKSIMLDIEGLPSDSQDEVIDIINRVACIRDYKVKIRWKLEGYTYGEIKPRGHRFFFFRAAGDTIVFFAYKKKTEIKKNTYKTLKKRKDEYEQQFNQTTPRDG